MNDVALIICLLVVVAGTTAALIEIRHMKKAIKEILGED
jgi:hypothetical protein